MFQVILQYYFSNPYQSHPSRSSIQHRRNHRYPVFPPHVVHHVVHHPPPYFATPFHYPRHFYQARPAASHVYSNFNNVNPYHEGGAIPFGRGGKCGQVFMTARQAGRIGSPIGLKALQKISSQFCPKDTKKTNESPIAEQEPSSRSYVINSNPLFPDNCRVVSKATKLPVVSDPDIEMTDPTPLGTEQSNELEDILIKCLSIKQECIDESDAIFGNRDNNLLVEQWRNSKIDYKNAKGRFYFSSLTENEILAEQNAKWLLTTSTLSNINCNVACKSDIVSIECPGATIKQMIRPLLTEMKCLESSSNAKLLVVGGVNNFLQGMNVDIVISEAVQLKKAVKFSYPNVQVTFMPIPLIPQLCKLPEDHFEIAQNRTLDFLIFNDYVRYDLSDTRSSISLQNIGLVPLSIGCSFWPGKLKVFVTGKKHDPKCWRETHLVEGVHLKDNVRIDFWNTQVKRFFYVKCSNKMFFFINGKENIN